MLKLLFDFNVFYDILIGIGVFLLIFACIKYPSAKWFVSTVLVVVFLGFTAFCVVNLHYYLTPTGGIFGSLGQLIQNNQLVSKDLNMTVENIVLTKDGDTDRYLAVCTTENENFNFDIDKKYTLLINETPCLIKDFNSNYVRADFSYEFYDEELESLLVDTLSLRFTFDNNIVTLKLYTDGGSTAVKYWNSYFSRNSMNINFSETSDTDSTYYSDYICISVCDQIIDGYNSLGRVWCNYYIHKNSTFNNIDQIDGYNFVGCKYNETDLSYIDLSTTKFTENTRLYAYYEANTDKTITIINNTGVDALGEEVPIGTTSVDSIALGTALDRSYFVNEINLGTSVQYIKTTLPSGEKGVLFLSTIDCGIVEKDKYNEYSAWNKYCVFSGNSYSFVVEDNYTFYVAYYLVEDSDSSGGLVVDPDMGTGNGSIS